MESLETSGSFVLLLIESITPRVMVPKCEDPDRATPAISRVQAWSRRWTGGRGVTLWGTQARTPGSQDRGEMISRRARQAVNVDEAPKPEGGMVRLASLGP